MFYFRPDNRFVSFSSYSIGGQGTREEMLIFLFLLFAESVNIPENQEDGDVSIDGIKNFRGKECTVLDERPKYSNVSLLPISSEPNETVASSSSPREINLTVMSPRESCTRSVVHMIEECGDVFALTPLGFDCLVRFLILSQASMKCADIRPIHWANSILESETRSYHSTSAVKGVQEQGVLYSFSLPGADVGQRGVQGQSSKIDQGNNQGLDSRQNNVLKRESLVMCSNGFTLPSIPVTLPMFLSLLDSSSELDFEDTNSGAYPININIPGNNCDIAEVIFSTSNLISSLSIFMEDVSDVYTASVREVMKEKQQKDQLENYVTSCLTRKHVEGKDENEVKKSLIMPIDSTDSDLNGSISPGKSNSKSVNNKSVIPEKNSFFGGKPNSPKIPKKQRKSLSTRVISPAFVVPVLNVDGSQSTHSLNDQDQSSIESGATDTTLDSSNGTDTNRGNASPATQKINGGTSNLTVSSILAALSSCSSHGTPTLIASDSLLPSNTTRNKLTTGGSGTVHPSIQSTELRNSNTDPLTLFESSACGLVNLGNTCFMSSALQCLVHSPLLKEYFISNKFRSHLNVQNPLGTKGVLTQEFASLIESMWGIALQARTAINSGQINHSLYRKHLKSQSLHGNSMISLTSLGAPLAPCFAPHDFKRVLQTCKSQFQGHEQQDVQEFLAELMVC